MRSPENSATEIFLETKLHLPSPRPGIVARARLLAILSDPPTALVLVSAPAGWGKTTLLADWARSGSGRFAWLSLDPADNDPARFWTYVLHALRTVEPALGGRALATLGTPGTSVLDAVLPGLLNEVAVLREAIVLTWGSPTPTSTGSEPAPKAGRPACTLPPCHCGTAPTRPGSLPTSPATTATSSTTSAPRCWPTSPTTCVASAAHLHPHPPFRPGVRGSDGREGLGGDAGADRAAEPVPRSP